MMGFNRAEFQHFGRITWRVMKSQPESDQPVSGEMKLDQSVACDGCGQFGAFRFEESTLCPECYQQSGACCAGCGQDDSDDC
jgi:hypothetical protein